MNSDWWSKHQLTKTQVVTSQLQFFAHKKSHAQTWVTTVATAAKQPKVSHEDDVPNLRACTKLDLRAASPAFETSGATQPRIHNTPQHPHHTAAHLIKSDVISGAVTAPSPTGSRPSAAELGFSVRASSSCATVRGPVCSLASRNQYDTIKTIRRVRRR
jgi:hypothetical protein